MAIGNHNDLTHIVRTSDQWKNTYDKYELIPVGVLCVELVSSDVTKIKIGDGHNIFSKLPYIGDLDLSKYYTKLETDTRIKEILTQEKVVRIKGIIGSKSDLPADARCGDIYFVRQLSSSDNKYIEYIYSPDNTWEPLGGIPVDIDLSEYAKTAYVDDKIEQVNERIDDIEQHGTHTHSNKEILDQITEPYTTADKETLASLHNYDDTEIREMISQSSHTHSNKDILDATSAAFTKEDKSKLDQLNPYDDSILKEKIQALERLAHEHSNKRILDRTTASFTTEYERKMRWIRLYTGCTGMEEGIAGLVPAAQAGEEDYVLSGSGEWVPQTGGGGTYELPIATASTLGGIKVGDGLEIDMDGKLSVVDSGDSIAEGDGITITTDPQTSVKTISVNTGNGLSINQDNELEINVGNGLLIDENGQVAFDESILPSDPTVYAPGVAISFVDNQNPYVTKVRWTVSEIRGGTGDSWIQLRYFGFYDSNQNRIPILTGIGAWEDGSTVSYYQHRTLNNMIANSYEMTASTWTGSNPFIMTFDLPSGTRLKDLKYFRYQTGDDENYRDPVSWMIHAYDEELDRWLLIDTETSATVPTDRNAWTSYFDLAYNSSSPSTSDVPIYDINVKYGNGLTVNQDNELEVNVGDGITVDANNKLTLDTSIQLILHCVPDPES